MDNGGNIMDNGGKGVRIQEFVVSYFITLTFIKVYIVHTQRFEIALCNSGIGRHWRKYWENHEIG